MMEVRWSSPGARLFSLILAILGSGLVALGLLALLSRDFPTATRLFFSGPFRTSFNAGNLLGEFSLLLLAGLGASVAFASRNYNLGGEGQVYLGAVAATFVASRLAGADTLVARILAAGAGAASGGILAWVSGRLKLGLGVDELISSFLLSATTVYLCDFLITGPLQDPASNFQATAPIPGNIAFARLLPPSNLSTAIIPVLAIVLLGAFIRSRTRVGFELGLVGKNPEFARYAGVDTKLYVSLPMAVSGALYGLAGAFLVLGSYHRAIKGFSGGLGWTGLAVALVAGNAPLAVIPAAFLFAYLNSGSKAVMVGADVTQDIVSIIEAAVFFLVTARFAEPLLARLSAYAKVLRGRSGRGGRR